MAGLPRGAMKMQIGSVARTVPWILNYVRQCTLFKRDKFGSIEIFFQIKAVRSQLKCIVVTQEYLKNSKLWESYWTYQVKIKQSRKQIMASSIIQNTKKKRLRIVILVRFLKELRTP